jgi:trypsin
MSSRAFVLLLSTTAASAGTLRNAKRDLRTRIIGGDKAVEDRYAYAVSLFDSYGHFCGGSLIAEDVVLSAAHCDSQGRGNYNAVVGRHAHTDNDGQEFSVKTALPHPDYDDKTTDNDFMLIFLNESATSNEFVRLNTDEATPEVGSAVTVMGWGDIDPTDEQELSSELMEVDVNVITNEECEKSDGDFGSYEDQITSHMLCAREEGGGEDSCQGDSGGPLVIKGADSSEDVQVGVVSWGIGCATADYPGVYARISSQYDWIKSEVCKGSKNPPSSFGCEDKENSAVTQNADVRGWSIIVTEEFRSGYGIFTVDSKSNQAIRYNSAKGKSGVIRMSTDGTSTLKSSQISVADSENKFKVSVDLYAVNLSHDDNFCVDYQTNTLHGEKCWKAMHDFPLAQWETKTFEFDAENTESLRLRLRLDATSESGDILISTVDVEGSSA